MVGFVLGLFVGFFIMGILFPYTAFVDTHYHDILFVSSATMSAITANLTIKFHKYLVKKYQLTAKSVYQRIALVFLALWLTVLTGIGFFSLLP